MSHDHNTNLVEVLRVFLEERMMTHKDILRDEKGAYVNVKFVEAFGKRKKFIKEYLPANLQEII